MGFIGKQPSKAAITSSDITDGIVTTDKIAADAITDAKIADDVVGTEHLTAGEVDTTALGADAVTGAKIADDAINSEHYTDGSIDTAHIADANVTQAKIADQAINEAKMQISNAPTNGYFLSAQSGNTGGLTWAEAGGGAYIHLQTQTVSSGVAQVDFTSNLATYDTIKFVFSGVHPATDNVTFLALVSTDGGSSYLSTTYNAAGAYLFSASSNGDQGNASDKIILNGACGNATNESQSGFLEMNNLASTTYYKNTQSLVTGVHDTGALIATHGGCSIHQTSAINGVRFKFSSGNIDAGTFSLYGVKRS